jgi:hypothetical protein
MNRKLIATQEDSPLLTTIDLAKRWNMNPMSLVNWRSQGKGPAFIHIGKKKKGGRPNVRYRLSDVIAFETKNREAV